MAGHSRLHETPLGTVLRTLPRGVEAEIVLLEVELQLFEARFVLVDQVGDASPQADDLWLLVEHVSGLRMD